MQLICVFAFTNGFNDAAHYHIGHVNLMVGNYLFSPGNSKSKYLLVHLCSLIINFLSLHLFCLECYGFMIKKVKSLI